MDPWETKSFGSSGTNRRSDSVTVRLEPRLRYCADLAARIQRRTLSSFIEEAISNGLAMIMLKDRDPANIHSLKDANELWDVFEPDRFVKLALHQPGLLTHHEQIVWKLIQECDVLWIPEWDSRGNERVDAFDEQHFKWKLLRPSWETFNKVARGELSPTKLPSKAPTSDEDIPF
jgi:hypothetical protein